MVRGIRAGQYVEQMRGYKAFIPNPLPPIPEVTEILRKAPLLEDGDAEQRRDSANLSGSRPRDFQHILYILY
ncbi:hypothetical protein [Phormidesmis sp. 146-35]